MKQRIILTLVMAGLLAPAVSHGQELSETFREGLFQEEANQNLSAAIESYQEVLRQFEEKQHIAASALFRLGECYRKQGETEKAGEFYRRVITEFGGQETLVRLAKQNLNAIDQPLPESGESGMAATDPQSKEIARIKEMIRQSPDLINAVGESGKTPLQEAAAKGQMEVARFLLQNGAEVDRRDPGGRTALHYATKNGRKAMAELLLENGADIDGTDKNGRPPLDYAVQKRYQILTKMLLNQGADPNIRFANRTSVLHTAVESEASSIVPLLLKHDAKVDPQDEHGRTPLFYAVRHADIQTIWALGQEGADINHPDNEGRTVLHEATLRHPLPIVKLLLKSGANPDIGNEEGLTALHLAVSSQRRQRIQIVKALLEHGADANVKTKNDGNTALHVATFDAEEHGAIATRLLLSYGANPNIRNTDNLTPLFTAIIGAEAQCLPIVEQLLDAGARTDVTDENGKTPLIVAVGRGKDPAVVSALLQAGADPNHFSPTGTALHIAMLQAPKITELLIEHGADVDTTSSKHGVTDTPLLFAVPYLTHTGDRGAHAAKNISVLLENGADPNAQGNDGNTALHELCSRMPERYGSTDSRRVISAVRTLLDQGADPNLLNDRNWTCFDMLDSDKPSVLRETLIKHGRRFLILVQREDRKEPIFFKRPDSLNQFTFFEAINELYSRRSDIADSLKEFPDLTQIRIHRRLEESDGVKTQRLNLTQAIEDNERSADVALEWGDIIEIPEIDHKLGAGWEGFPWRVAQHIESKLEREITITLPGATHSTELVAHLQSSPKPDTAKKEGGNPKGVVSRRNARRPSSSSEPLPQPEPLSPTQGQKRIGYFRFQYVVQRANVLRSSSDTSRIRLVRPRPGKQPIEATLDLEKTNRRTDLWLKNGDTLHIPEK